MTSIRKTKKALKREIRRIDTRLKELSTAALHPLEPLTKEVCGRACAEMWDLFLYRGCLLRKLESFKKGYEENPFTTPLR